MAISGVAEILCLALVLSFEKRGCTEREQCILDTLTSKERLKYIIVFIRKWKQQGI